MGILDNYLKQVEEDKKNGYNDDINVNYNDELMEKVTSSVDADAVRKRINELRNDPNDMENKFNAFMMEYPRTTEEMLDNNNNTKIDSSIKIVVKHAYCPSCGAEIQSKAPLMFNPFTMEKIAKYDCQCGAKYNFEHSYPRIVFLDKDNKEIKVFSD